ncbi:unnamed protein product [Arabidopsis halleri]
MKHSKGVRLLLGSKSPFEEDSCIDGWPGASSIGSFKGSLGIGILVLAWYESWLSSFRVSLSLPSLRFFSYHFILLPQSISLMFPSFGLSLRGNLVFRRLKSSQQCISPCIPPC